MLDMMNITRKVSTSFHFFSNKRIPYLSGTESKALETEARCRSPYNRSIQVTLRVFMLTALLPIITHLIVPTLTLTRYLTVERV